MKKLNLETAEMLAAKMRGELLRISGSEPINMKTTLRQLNVMTMYISSNSNVMLLQPMP